MLPENYGIMSSRTNFFESGLDLRTRKALTNRACRSCDSDFSPPGYNVIYCDSCRTQCQEPGCTSPVRKGGKCAKHSRVYYDVPDHAGIHDGICASFGCDRSILSKGLCELHYRRFRLTGELGDPKPKIRVSRNNPCLVEGCGRPSKGDGLCITHYKRRAKHGHVGPAELLRAEMGTGSITSTGYRKVVDEKGNYYFEHRLVMEKVIGRKLRKGENVHHRDGDRLNNHPDNLELWSVLQPSGQRVEDKLRAAFKLIEEYPEFSARLGKKLIDLNDETVFESDHWKQAS